MPRAFLKCQVPSAGEWVVVLENETLKAGIDATRGACLRELHYKPAGANLVVIACAFDTSGIHAQFQNLPFEAIAERRDETGCSLALQAAFENMKLVRAFSLEHGESCLCLDETLENLDTHEREMLWGWGVALGSALIDSDTRIDAPAVSYFDPREEPILRMRWPRLADGTDLATTRCTSGGKVRRVYLTDFNEGRCAVVSPARKLRVELRWDAAVFPYCWIEEHADAITLAPFSGMPNAIEEGHGLVAIPAGSSLTARFEVRTTELP